MAKERTDDNPATPEEVQNRIWELAAKIDVGMLTTWDGEQQHSRPLAARVRREEHAIYFLVDEAGKKNAQIEAVSGGVLCVVGQWQLQICANRWRSKNQQRSSEDCRALDEL